MKNQPPVRTALLPDRIEGHKLTQRNLQWIEDQISKIANPFAKVLILLLLLHIRKAG